MKIRPVRGTHDIIGEELSVYRFIESKVSEFAKIYDYNEIITPIFENSDLFKKPLGEKSDVVLKEMYSFKDRNDSLLTLRPEFTTPIIRAAISNNLIAKLPAKFFSFGPAFRRERPQKGRYRQFNQINFELLGSEDTTSDVELIILANQLLESIINKKNFKLYINSLGDKDTIVKFKENLSKYFKKYQNDLTEESRSKIKTNPLRILDSKNKKDLALIKSAPKIYELYSNNAKQKFEDVQNLLSNLNIDFKIDSNLVRGLDYYCHTVFEFKTSFLGSQDTIIGGGRYDGLIKMLGGKDIPGIGWAGGVERMMLLSKKIENEKNLVHMAILDSKYKSYALFLINELRKNKIKITLDYKYNLKKSLQNASSNNSKFAIIIGEEEFKNNIYTIKNLSKGNQTKLNLKEIINLLSK